MNRSGATVPVQSMKACVVYDSTNGEIHHHHRVLTLVGGREPTEDQIAADALRAIKNRRNAPSGVLESNASRGSEAADYQRMTVPDSPR